MIVTTQQLKEKYSYLSDHIGKISRDVESKKIFPLVKGIYETNANVHGSKIAPLYHSKNLNLLAKFKK